MSEQASDKPRRCELCGGKPSWVRPEPAGFALCDDCGRWFDGTTGRLRIFGFIPAAQQQ